ncbi:acid-sensing ion channel 1C-like [Diadema setosum]|uniref:acid-sensing ion channel 1C-like n=1 Tax=Diadema setosum TaxID=31175 RepID=UPI003B3A9D79
MPTHKVSVKPAENEANGAPNPGARKPPLVTRKSKVFAVSDPAPSITRDNAPKTDKSKLNDDIIAQINAQVNDISYKTKPQDSVSIPMPPPVYKDRVSWMAIFYKSIPDSIGVSGVKYALNVGENRMRRLFWTLLILSGVGLTSYQIVDRIKYYASYPKSVDVAFNYTNEVPFPAVAICNYNQYKYDRIAGTPYGDLVSQFSFDPASINYSLYEPSLTGVNMTELLFDLSPDIEDTFYQITIGTTILSPANFTKKLTNFGVCFVFNTGEDGSPPITMKAPGQTFGLSIIMNTEQSDYFFEEFNRYAAGFHIILYDRGSIPDADIGFSIRPGTRSQVALDVVEVRNLPAPHGECQDKELDFYDSYGLQECQLECMTKYIVSQCDCRAAFMPGNASVCDPIEYFRCGAPAYAGYLESLGDCDCPVPCFSRSYVATTSFTSFPSLFWANTLTYTLFAGQNLTSSYFTDNMIYLIIYFKAPLSIEQISQQKAYTFFSLLCDIGGSLGLWLGGSILTIFEFFDLFGNSVYVYTKRIPHLR